MCVYIFYIYINIDMYIDMVGEGGALGGIEPVGHPEEEEEGYRGISLIINSPPPQDHHRALGIVLQQGPRRGLLLMHLEASSQRVCPEDEGCREYSLSLSLSKYIYIYKYINMYIYCRGGHLEASRQGVCPAEEGCREYSSSGPAPPPEAEG